ncbi:MAPEG family protein [Neisseria sp.]|uniref:MAPEG family protein n=1 Tax=Neisseria sp. TaxID=192066 RepID=UPI0028A2483F|nr:MAPEG family protein [Neisseria sp.]
MNWVHIVALLALIQFIFFGYLVARARSQYNVAAPKTTGDERFERILRVQTNTLEQLLIFLPALFIAAEYWSEGVIALLGAVYLIGRMVYWRSYTADPNKRAFGFMLTAAPSFALILAGLAGAVFMA